MKNEIYREIAYWGSIGAVVLGLINIIICFVKGINIYNTELQGDFIQLIMYPAGICFYTILYKISLAVTFLTLVMMSISYLINTDGILKILMIICKAIQLICVLGCLIGFFIFKDVSFIKLSMLFFAVMELIALILYLIDREHRKTIIRVVVFALLTVGSGVIYTVIVFLLMIVICFFLIRLLYSFFREPEHIDVLYDVNGKILGWIKRE